MATITLPTRGTSLLPRDITDMIFEDVARTSAVQQLARRVNLPLSGVAIPITTGKPSAGWVAEGAAKPVSDATLDVKLMDPKKLATIVIFSEEYIRSDRSLMFDNVRDQIREAFADAFDAAAIHGTNTPFAAHLAQTTKTVELGTNAAGAGGVYKDLVDGLSLLVSDRKKLTGFAADPAAEPILLGSVDGNGRPILVDTDAGTVGQRLIGRPVAFGEGVGGGETVDEDLRLIGGDWTKVAYGVGREITFDVSNQATVTLADDTVINLWQRNLVAVRAEAEYGFVIGDIDAFVEYVDAAS